MVSAMKRRKVSNFKGKMGIMFREREMEIFHHSEMTPRGKRPPRADDKDADIAVLKEVVANGDVEIMQGRYDIKSCIVSSLCVKI